MEADVFRPQSVGRALRTAFVLGVLIVVALVAAVAATHQFSVLVGDNTKDELSRYLDDNAHTTATPSGAGFKIDFPVPASREAEKVTTPTGGVTAPRDRAVVDDEVTFDAIWFSLPGTLPANRSTLVPTLVRQQLHQLHGTKIGSSAGKKVGSTLQRDIAFVTVDTNGTKHYYDERVLLNGRKVWILRVGSHIRRDAVFNKFVHSLTFTK